MRKDHALKAGGALRVKVLLLTAISVLVHVSCGSDERRFKAGSGSGGSSAGGASGTSGGGTGGVSSGGASGTGGGGTGGVSSGGASGTGGAGASGTGGTTNGVAIWDQNNWDDGSFFAP